MPSLKDWAQIIFADKTGNLGGDKAKALAELRNRAGEAGQTLAQYVEPTLAVGSGLVGSTVGGVVGTAGLPYGVDTAANAVKRTQDWFQYVPKTEGGQRGMQKLGGAMESLEKRINTATGIGAGALTYAATGDPQKAAVVGGDVYKKGAGQSAGDYVADTTGSPLLATGVAMIPEVIDAVAGTKLAGKIPGKAYEMGDIGNQQFGQRGAVAFHGTPHEVDKFSMDKIGTGEGNQAFGWGAYFGKAKGTGESYRSQLTLDGYSIDGKDFNRNSLDQYQLKAAQDVTEYGYESALAKASKRDEQKPTARTAEIVSSIKALNGKEVKKSGNLYRVNIPDDDTILSYDLPLSEQSGFVKKVLGRDDKWMTGRGLQTSIYGAIADRADEGLSHLPKVEEFIRNTPGADDISSAKLTSLYFNSLGIKGLRYFDAISRDSKDGSYNYVIWDEDSIRIDAKNDVDVPENELIVKRDGGPAMSGGDKIDYTKGAPVYRGVKPGFEQPSEYRPVFFSADERYASQYGEVSPHVLDVKKPFDPSSDSDARRFYNESFVGSEYGAKARLLEKGEKIPFTDADDFWSFASVEKEMGAIDYDSMIVSEKAPSGYLDEAIVPFSIKQITRGNK